ncbi:MAG: amidophosphoribosyltransferase [Dehalococcoidaceae bacterium]|nr:amidophosphoribosyltransferase [Dehalococcoidaceae bacterium]
MRYNLPVIGSNPGDARSGLHEACGVFGIYSRTEDISRITFFALFALQHRGQESAGIATANGKDIQLFSRMGLVSQVFDEKALRRLKGHIAIGHNRYSTTGSSRRHNAQPIVVNDNHNEIAIAHNGNIANSEALRAELESQGFTFNTTTDSEIIAQLILSAPHKEWHKKMRYAMYRLEGAFSLAIMTRTHLFAMRDPHGVRPLCLGQINGSGHVIASESCALDHIGAQFIREIEPGEIISINDEGVKSYKGACRKRAFCIFEYIYFARPDSVINDRLVYHARQAMGEKLAEEYPVDADIVIGVPDSATPAGVGYSLKSGIPPATGLIKNRYMGRTFIEPDQRLRDLGVKLKFNPMSAVLEGQRVVLVDDSIVRGTTTPQVIKLLRKAGAKEVHMRVCAPPICHPCFFGVDMATRWELLASRKSVEEIRQFIGADSLGYLSIEGLVEAIGLPKELFCLACFTGEYALPVQLEMDKLAFETLPRDGKPVKSKPQCMATRDAALF